MRQIYLRLLPSRRIMSDSPDSHPKDFAMRTAVLSLAVLLCLACVLRADDIRPDLWKVGDEGYVREQGNAIQFTIGEVIDKETLLIKRLGQSYPAFIVEKYPTKGLSDDEKITFVGTYKVTGTRKYNGRTYKVLEPQKK